MKNSLSTDLYSFLRKIGYRDDQISRMDESTRLLHDLNNDGDNLIEILENLRDKFGVNIEKFEYKKYGHWERELIFPFSIKRDCLTILHKIFPSYCNSPDKDIEPLTLGMIEKSIKLGRLSEEDF